MKGDKVDTYMVMIHCAFYSKYNVDRPKMTGCFNYELMDEFIGDELQAKSHFVSKYTKVYCSPFSELRTNIISVYKLIQEEVPSNGR